jgi:hypothetical protein
MSFGWSMDGLEERFTEAAKEVRARFQPCTYLEIGVARGETLASVAKALNNGKGDGWRAVGVDLPNGYSLDKPQIEQNCTCKMLNMSFIKPNGWNHLELPWNRVSVVLADSRDFFEGMWTDPVHLALIDACHCKECAMRDFLNVEKFVPSGGLVLFHDFEERLKSATQPHGGHCDVVGACRELGLLDNKREGWAPGETWVADHKRPGADMFAVRKI